MDILPAIDLRGGHVVRLYQGDYDQETVYDTTPIEMARRWREAGARWIHIVDLDGARDGAMKNREAIREITANVEIQTELGGGLRDLDAIRYALEELEVSRIILGSVLLENPELAREAAEEYPGQIVLGIDARDGMAATRGWRETSKVSAIQLAREFAGPPFAAVIYTDIARDGALVGPNLESLRAMAEASPFPVIASGGIGSLDDIRAVARLSHEIGEKRLPGVIVGKALYENKFSLEEALAAAIRAQ